MKSQKLNMGCGLDIRKGYVNLDSVKLKGVDVIHDLNRFPYPFKDSTFDEVYTSHVLEHVDDLIRVMKELKRICKNGAKIIVRVPHFSCGVSYRDPTHRRLFSYFTFDYFTDYSFYGLPHFKINRKSLNFTRWSFTFLNYLFNPIINLNQGIYERFFCWMIPCSEALFELEVIK
ncbi:class I SAM-dependent methyltransferase [Candidatus Pacearchaeota archaeon]|nr:class I SAM-dependent methyltransferase [Candidatus Pacearchaeota archaeon]